MTNSNINTDVLADIKVVLEKELAEVTFEPRLTYHLDFEEHTPKEYQQKLFRLREAVQQSLDDFCEQDTKADIGDVKENGQTFPTMDSSISHHLSDRYEKTDVCKLVFYLIPEETQPHVNQSEIVLYDTPYFETEEECIQHICSDVRELRQLTWELCRYAAAELPFHFLKDTIMVWQTTATTTYAWTLHHLWKWLQTGLSDPDNLMSEDSSDYEGHFKVTVPDYNIDAYVRFEGGRVWLPKKNR